MSEWAIEQLQDPRWLLLGLLPLALCIALARRDAPALAWPALGEARLAGASGRDGWRWLSVGVRCAACLLLVAVLARPVSMIRLPAEGAGLDLVLVIDTSGSMQALDAEVDGEWRRRIDLAREVVSRFALHRVSDGDRVGLVVFGETAFTQCPLTRDGDLLGAALERVDAGVAGESTALGDALALAVKRAGSSEDASGGGRLIVLLTDGRSNAGTIPVDVATGIAKTRGIRVHTVGIGSEGDEVPMAAPDGQAGRGLRFQRHDLDVATLQRIAETTLGRFYHVRSSNDLEDVYAEIDAVERVAREIPEETRPEPRPEPLLALAGLLLLCDASLGRVLRRSLP